MRLAVPGRLLVPVHVGALPPPYSLRGVSTVIGGYRAGQSGVTGWESLIEFTRGGSQTDLSIEVNATRPFAPPPYGSRTTINGRGAFVSNTTVTIEGSGFECRLMVSGFTSVSPLTRSQLVALASTLSFPQQINKIDSWYDATTALP